MNEYEMIISYLTAVVGRFRDDERGLGVAETIVLTGFSLLGAAAIAVILWNKLKTGAGGIEVPSPQAP